MTTRTTRHPFVRMVEIATEVGLPQRFVTDLHVHDLAWLCAYPHQPFGWVLYEGGTHLHRRGIKPGLCQTLTGPDWPGARYFVSDEGSSLRAVTACEWAEWMQEEIPAEQWIACERQRHVEGLRLMILQGGIVGDYAQVVVDEALQRGVRLRHGEVVEALRPFSRLTGALGAA